ncbi:MAG: class II aldolase/adducin family protein [Pseudomonadota bacterium]
MSAAAHELNGRSVSEAEWEVRVDLAALYRLFVRYGWTDLIYTHISARVPGEPEHYLINPFGPLFDEITASSLIKVDFDGNVVEGDGEDYNEAGHLIHSAVLRARPEINYVLHTHSRAGTAVSAMRCGLLPLSQHANVVLGTVGYHEYADVTTDEEGCERLARDIADHYLLVMHNHGLLACGRVACEAFHYLYYLEMACKIQVDVLTSGTEYVTPAPAVVDGLKEWGKPGDVPKGQREWPTLLRMLDRADDSYRD